MKKNVYQFKPHVGRHIMGQRVYGPGDTIELYEWQTEGFIDKLVLVQTGEPPAPVQPEPSTVPMIIRGTVDGGFDVYRADSTQPINNVALTEAEARELAGPGATFLPAEANPPAVEARRRRGQAPAGIPSISADVPSLTVIHKGAGRYVVLDEATGQVVAGGQDGHYLTKAEAEQYVASKIK
jgi:hypothetical protein